MFTKCVKTCLSYIWRYIFIMFGKPAYTKFTHMLSLCFGENLNHVWLHVCSNGFKFTQNYLYLNTWLQNSIFRCVSTSRFHKITDSLTESQTLSFVWLCMTLYDFVWLCMTMYEGFLRDLKGLKGILRDFKGF